MPPEKNEEFNQTADTDQGLENLPDNQNNQDFGEVLASWQFQEFFQHQRGRVWYIIFILAIVGLLIFAYTSKNPLFAIIIILGLIVYVISEKRGPQTIEIALTEDGVILHNKFIDYEDLDSFYIIYYPPLVKNLYLQPRNSFKPLISIPLEDQNPVEIRRLLLAYLAEDLEKEEAPLTEGLTHRLKL